jgi:hypothetical protein
MQFRKSKRVLLLLLMLGFFFGIIYANLISTEYIESYTVFGSYFQNIYDQKTIVREDWLLWLILLRGMPALILFLLGYTAFRVPSVVVTLLWTGFALGTYLTAGILLLQGRGLLLGILAFFPQIFFYAPACFLVLWNLYSFSSNCIDYCKIIFTIVLILCGIASESFINPVFLQIYVNKF